MAPAGMAGRLLLPVMWIFTLFLSTILNTTASLLAYDRRTLLSIRSGLDNVPIDFVSWGGTNNSSLPPFLCEIPADLRRTPCFPRRKKRFRGGRLVKIKTFLALFPNVDPRGMFGEWNVDYRCYAPWRSVDPVYRWLFD